MKQAQVHKRKIRSAVGHIRIGSVQYARALRDFFRNTALFCLGECDSRVITSVVFSVDLLNEIRLISIKSD
jgi:hypothetical protein